MNFMFEWQEQYLTSERSDSTRPFAHGKEGLYPWGVCVLCVTFIPTVKLACSRLSVSGHDRKSGRGTSGIWPGKKKLEKAREGEPVSIVLKTSFRPLLRRQHFKDVKCQNLRCRVTRVCITTSRHVLIFLQFLYMSSLSTKISSNIEAFPSKCCSFARIYSTLRKLQNEQTTALWTPLEQSESHAISLAAKRTLNLSASLGAVSRRWLALSDINRQSVKYMELTSLHDFHGS